MLKDDIMAKATRDTRYWFEDKIGTTELMRRLSKHKKLWNERK